MNMKFSKSTLMSGNDYPLTSSITLHHPTIREMLNINQGHDSEQIYWNYIHLLLSDPYANMVFLDDIGKNFMETSPFEVFLLQWDNLYQNYMEHKAFYDKVAFHPFSSITSALQFFIAEEHDFVKSQYEDGSFCLVDRNNASCQINQEIYEYIYQWVKSIHKIDYSGRIQPQDENARRILIEDTRSEIKKQSRKKEKNNDDVNYIGSLMSAVSFGGNGVITPFHLNECKMYWLFEAFSIENKKSNASHILDGLYHGTLSSKDIDKKELDWTK